MSLTPYRPLLPLLPDRVQPDSVFTLFPPPVRRKNSFGHEASALCSAHRTPQASSHEMQDLVVLVRFDDAGRERGAGLARRE
jgi:hypothetical protein